MALVSGSVNGWSTRRLSAALMCLFTVLLPVSVRGEDSATGAEPVTDAGPGARDEPASAPEGVAQDESTPRFDVSGKVFARAAADERAQYERELSVPLARLQVKARFGIAQAVMEADIASRSLIKDAYLRLEPFEDIRLYAGNFKAPFLARALESRWDLPLISRGLVDDFLTERQQLAGRRIGVMGEVKQRKWMDLEVQFGLFQGGEDELGGRLGEDAAARITFEPWDKHLELGVGGYWADAVNGSSRYSGGADATFELGGARLMVEGLVGRLPVGDFTAQLVLLTWTVPVGAGQRWALEPLVGAEALQLYGEAAGVARAAVLGLNVHYTERLKLMIQGERGLFPGDTTLQNRLAVQLAARF